MACNFDLITACKFTAIDPAWLSGKVWDSYPDDSGLEPPWGHWLFMGVSVGNTSEP